MKQTVICTAVGGVTQEIPVSELTWRPSTYAIVIQDNKVLLVREQSGFHLPGGGLALGEMPEDGVIREVHEETGLTVADPRLVGSLSTFFTSSPSPDDSEPRHYQSLLLYYLCDFVSGELSTDGLEADEKAYDLTPEWIPLADLPNITLGSTVDWRPIVQKAVASGV